MLTIGLIGGMSWESSIEYYRLVNQLVRERLGGHHNAKSLMYTVDFAEVEAMQREGRWPNSAALLADAAQRLERGGADFIVLCTNTMHKVAPEIQAAVNIPLIHIAEAAAERVKAAEIQTVGLLGTRFTMEQDFYTEVLAGQYGIKVLIPEIAEREVIHRIIYDELVMGVIKPESRRAYAEIMANLVARGAGGILLACTEIMLLVKPEDSSVPQFDTTRIHVEKAVALALQ